MTIYGDDISYNLPTAAYERGYRLYEMVLLPSVDPIQLRDKKGTLILQWNHIPSLAELFEACGRLSEGGRPE